MKRLLILILIITVMVSVSLLGCSSVPSSEPTSTQTPTTTESQAEIEALKEELNRLREQKKAEILEGAEAYYAILEFCAAGSFEPSGIRRATAESVAELLKACSEFWGLIKATKDPELISRCQPQGEWHLTPCRCSQVKDYCWSMYKKLIAEYNELQPLGGQFIIPKLPEPKPPVPEQPVEKTEEKVVTPKPEIEESTPKPKVNITVVVEYEGEWAYQVTTTSYWSFVWYGLFSGNKSKVFENIQLPWHCRAQISDEGTSPLVLKILYNGQVVAQDTAIGQDGIAYVFWEGP